MEEQIVKAAAWIIVRVWLAVVFFAVCFISYCAMWLTLEVVL